jgi:hypothetical protein
MYIKKFKHAYNQINVEPCVLINEKKIINDK